MLAPRGGELIIPWTSDLETVYYLQKQDRSYELLLIMHQFASSAFFILLISWLTSRREGVMLRLLSRYLHFVLISFFFCLSLCLFPGISDNTGRFAWTNQFVGFLF